MTIWTLGDAVVDLLPQDVMHYQACAGGAPVNVAVGAALLGQQSGFIGRVGNDAFGHFLCQTMTDAGVNTRHLEFDDCHRTSTVLVSLDAQGDRQFTFLVNPSADQFLSPAALPAFQADILHFCSLALVAPACRDTLNQAVAAVQGAAGLVSFDINLREQMWSDRDAMRREITRACQKADMLKMSEEEWFWLTQCQDASAARQALDSLPARLKIVTRGEQGAIVFWQGQRIHFAGYAVKSIDTTGAGDAFMAGLLAGVAENGWPGSLSALTALIAQACGCGALATTQKGAVNAIPAKPTLAAFIQDNPPLCMEIHP